MLARATRPITRLTPGWATATETRCGHLGPVTATAIRRRQAKAELDLAVLAGIAVDAAVADHGPFERHQPAWCVPVGQGDPQPVRGVGVRPAMPCADGRQISRDDCLGALARERLELEVRGPDRGRSQPHDSTLELDRDAAWPHLRACLQSPARPDAAMGRSPVRHPKPCEYLQYSLRLRAPPGSAHDHPGRTVLL